MNKSAFFALPDGETVSIVPACTHKALRTITGISNKPATCHARGDSIGCDGRMLFTSGNRSCPYCCLLTDALFTRKQLRRVQALTLQHKVVQPPEKAGGCRVLLSTTRFASLPQSGYQTNAYHIKKVKAWTGAGTPDN